MSLSHASADTSLSESLSIGQFVDILVGAFSALIGNGDVTHLIKCFYDGKFLKEN